VAREERNFHGSEFDADTDFVAPAREVAWDEKLVIAKAAVGGLDVVLGGAEFFGGV